MSGEIAGPGCAGFGSELAGSEMPESVLMLGSVMFPGLSCRWGRWLPAPAGRRWRSFGGALWCARGFRAEPPAGHPDRERGSGGGLGRLADNCAAGPGKLHHGVTAVQGLL